MKSRITSRILFGILAVLLLALLAYTPSYAQGPGGQFKATPLTPDSTIQGVKLAKPASNAGMVSVIVKFKGAPLATYRGGVSGLAPTSAGGRRLNLKSAASQAYLKYLDKQHADLKATISQAIQKVQVTHDYNLVLNAASMLVPADQVGQLAKTPGVEAVYPDELLHLDTDNSPQFIGAPTIWNQLGGQESAGEGVVVGVLDTGVWPEHPSFSDPDPSGKPYAAPPPPLSGARQCEFSGGSNPGPAFTCNNKLIGADRFMATYEAVIGLAPGEFTTARDDDGHGTHTSSTAAGNANVNASIFGISRGKVSGIAPRAHVIMYKVCGEQGCFQSDSAAAVQKAITDGVNVINFSISGGANPFSDPVELAFLGAYNAGVFVAASAGNSGPTPDTTDHRGPWTTTVAASTQNRAFETTATLTAGGASVKATGASLTQGITNPTPLVYAGDAPFNDPFCLKSDYAPGTFAGKVVVCERGGGGLGRASKGLYVLNGGAVGMILYNNAANVTDLETDNHFLPAVHIQYADGLAILAFMQAHPDATVTWPAGAKVSAQGDVMASFSSRGGPGQTLGVSKPDITAPGVQILAGASPQHVGIPSGPQGELFQAIAGTSMSSPHIAGSGALLKALHPNWTPGQIKSALMTTALTKNLVKEDGVTPFDAFDAGSGRVNLQFAGDPGVTFDATGADYVTYRNQLYRSNYPSLYIPSMPGAVTVQRTLHSVLSSNATWTLSVVRPKDLKVTVPASITVPAGGNATFNIAVDARDMPLGATRFATLKLVSGQRELHFPITIVRGQAAVTLDKSCAPAVFPKNSNTTCTLTVTNPAFADANVSLTDNLPSKLRLVPGSVVGATPNGNGVVFNGTLPASQPPDVAIAPGSSPAGGYLPLSLFGIPPVAGVDDDTITNFNVPAFLYGGEVYTRVGFSSNGYVVIGGGSGPDNSINNQNFPNPSRPNNVLALFWTDLNPGAAGAMRIGTLSDGSDKWIVMDWEGVREFSTAGNLHSFQVWIGVNSDAHPGEDISYAYGPNTGNGDLGFLSVGAENRFGNRGQNTYYNGTGTLPSNGTQLRVTTIPGAVTSKTITFQANGQAIGDWTNYAEMTGDTFFGTSIASFSGTVTK